MKDVVHLVLCHKKVLDLLFYFMDHSLPIMLVLHHLVMVKVK